MSCVLERYPIPSVLKCVHSYVRITMQPGRCSTMTTHVNMWPDLHSAGPAQAVGPVVLWPYNFYKLEIFKN